MLYLLKEEQKMTSAAKQAIITGSFVLNTSLYNYRTKVFVLHHSMHIMSIESVVFTFACRISCQNRTCTRRITTELKNRIMPLYSMLFCINIMQDE